MLFQEESYELLHVILLVYELLRVILLAFLYILLTYFIKLIILQGRKLWRISQLINWITRIVIRITL